MYINLLSYEHQRRQVIRTRVRQWMLAWLAIMPLLITAGCWQWVRYRDSTRQLVDIQHKYAPLEQLNQENELLTTRLAELRQREQLVLDLDDQLSVVELLGHVSQAAAVSGGAVSVRHFTVAHGPSSETRNSTSTSRAAPVNALSRGILTLQGIGVDNASVAQFVSQLRASEAFLQVHLSSAAPVKVSGREARNYQLQCTF
jgi:hypothetical protein